MGIGHFKIRQRLPLEIPYPTPSQITAGFVSWSSEINLTSFFLLFWFMEDSAFVSFMEGFTLSLSLMSRVYWLLDKDIILW